MTGHTNLTNPSIHLVRAELTQVLSRYADDLVGMTCLARGADQAFADAILRLDGRLVVVVPSKDYFSSIRDTASRQRCDAYLAAAQEVVQVGHDMTGVVAYTSANHYVVDHSDLLVAVWDGSPPAGNGGTSDTIAYAQRQQRTIERVWPEGTRRA